MLIMPASTSDDIGELSGSGGAVTSCRSNGIKGPKLIEQDSSFIPVICHDLLADEKIGSWTVIKLSSHR